MGYLPSGGAAARSADTPNIRRHSGQQALSKGPERDGTPSPPQADSGQDRVPTSKTSNLAVLTLDQVFFSLATGLRFMPAAGGTTARVRAGGDGPHRAGGGAPGARTLTDDGHHGVEVPDVEALSGHIDEELQHASPMLLLHHLEGSQTAQRGPHQGSSPTTPAPKVQCPGPTEGPPQQGAALGPQSCQAGGGGILTGCRGRKCSRGIFDAGQRDGRVV